MYLQAPATFLERQQFGPALLASVPDEWLGRLVGVSGDLIQRCRQEMRIPAGALGCREQD
ncbi:hypothetical protein ACVW0B_000973 [Thermostichus sp. MS-CIW-23]